jgi:hypothetical protein
VQVLDERAILRDRLSTRAYQRYMTNFVTDVMRKHVGPEYTNGQGHPDGRAFTTREVVRLNMSEAYFVTAEMMPLVRWASAGLDNTDSFAHDLWPTDHGFVIFEDSLITREMWGRTVTTCAMSWGRLVANGRPGTLVVFYTDINDPRDEVNKDVLTSNRRQELADMGRLHVHHIQFIADSQLAGPPVIVPEADYAKWAVGTGQTLASEVDNDTRFILALLMMLNQTVTSLKEAEVDRRTQKRMGRMNLPSRVTVVQLRRTAGSRSEGESMVEWSHRWVVRGHWRNQPYKAEDGSVTYRKIWIAPYIKGPEDMPFKQSEKVYSLSR